MAISSTGFVIITVALLCAVTALTAARVLPTELASGIFGSLSTAVERLPKIPLASSVGSTRAAVSAVTAHKSATVMMTNPVELMAIDLLLPIGNFYETKTSGPHHVNRSEGH